MIINFTDPDGNEICISDCVKFYTDNSCVWIERKSGNLLHFDFDDRPTANKCYQTMLESAKEWAKIQYKSKKES